MLNGTEDFVRVWRRWFWKSVLSVVFWVSQAAPAIRWTDSDGVTAKRDHPDTCAHAGTKLPAYQTESLQQPNNHTLRLSQVRDSECEIYKYQINLSTYSLRFVLFFLLST